MPSPSSTPAPASVMIPSYSDVAARQPLPVAPVRSQHASGCVAAVPTAPGPRSAYPTWQSLRQHAPFSHPVCYYCIISGHIAASVADVNRMNGMDTQKTTNISATSQKDLKVYVPAVSLLDIRTTCNNFMKYFVCQNNVAGTLYSDVLTNMLRGTLYISATSLVDAI